jgi:hypothetical protein
MPLRPLKTTLVTTLAEGGPKPKPVVRKKRKKPLHPDPPLLRTPNLEPAKP